MKLSELVKKQIKWLDADLAVAKDNVARYTDRLNRATSSMEATKKSLEELKADYKLLVRSTK